MKFITKFNNNETLHRIFDGRGVKTWSKPRHSRLGLCKLHYKGM